MILPDFETKNIFSLFDGYYRSAYTNNSLAEAVLRWMNMKFNLDFFEPREYLAL
jgi:hypothetical protein